MAQQQTYLGHILATQFNDADVYADDGSALRAVRVSQQIRVDGEPTAQTDVVRQIDLTRAVLTASGIATGTYAARPEADEATGLYFATDVGRIFFSNGTTWLDIPSLSIIDGTIAGRPDVGIGGFYYARDIQTLYYDDPDTGTWMQVSPGLITVGLGAARPDPSGSGKFYYASDSQVLWFDSGAWVVVGPVPSGYYSSRPAGQVAGRVFFASDRNLFYYDTGSVWRPAGQVQDGLAAALPAAGVRGRMYYATNTNVLYYDTGAAWVAVSEPVTPTAVRTLEVADIDDPVELEALEPDGTEIVLAYEPGLTADAATLYRSTGLNAGAGSTAPYKYEYGSAGQYWLAIGGRYVAGDSEVEGTLTAATLVGTDATSIRAVAVTNIDAPTELATLAALNEGEVIIAYSMEFEDNLATLYRFTAATMHLSPPYAIDNGSGFWVAVGGRYHAGASWNGGAFTVLGEVTTTTLGVTSTAIIVGRVTAPSVLGSGTKPTVAAGAGAGSGGAAVLVGRDLCGEVTVTTGSSASAGILATVTYNAAFTGNMGFVSLTAANAVTCQGVANWYVQNSANKFEIVARSALSDSTVYKWSYQVVGAPYS